MGYHSRCSLTSDVTGPTSQVGLEVDVIFFSFHPKRVRLARGRVKQLARVACRCSVATIDLSLHVRHEAGRYPVVALSDVHESG